jgi:hypothetical protein
VDGIASGQSNPVLVPEAPIGLRKKNSTTLSTQISISPVSPEKVIDRVIQKAKSLSLEIVSVVLVHLSTYRSQTRANRANSINPEWRPFLLLTGFAHG